MQSITPREQRVDLIDLVIGEVSDKSREDCAGVIRHSPICGRPGLPPNVPHPDCDCSPDHHTRPGRRTAPAKGRAGVFLGTIVIVLILLASAVGVFRVLSGQVDDVGFLVVEDGSLSGKLDRMATSSERAKRTRQVMTNISTGISSYIWAKTIMSLLRRAISFVVLKALKVDFAETWALLNFPLNYIPSIGSTLGVVFPALLALIQFDTTWQFLVIASILTSTHFLIGNVSEPALMGRTLNISPFVVMASLAFLGG